MNSDVTHERQALEMKISLAQKVAQRYENRNATDDPHYAEVLQLIADLAGRLSALDFDQELARLR